jgi:hypothetical protein
MAWWSNLDPVLEQTVTTLRIEGPPKLNPSMQMLCGLPSPLGWGFEPASLIRAINHFRELGKNKSVAAFREFLEIAPDAGYGSHEPPDPENIDTANQWCLSILVPFVFQDFEPQQRHFFSDIVIQDGIPFHTVVIGGTSGWPPEMKPLVDLAEKEGKIETDMLKPSNEPLQAAEKLYDRLHQSMTKEAQETEQFWAISLKTHLRNQAYSLVRHLVEDPADTARQRGDTRLTNDRWHDLKAKLDRMEIHWNEEKGLYEKVE